jgi:hypothetical protein
MAMENRFAYRNAGTEKAPVWQEWLAATVADYVFMDATGNKNIKTYVDEKIAALIGGATPETLDTLSEIATWIESHKEVSEALNQAITKKADKDHRHNNATASADGFMSKEDKTKLDGIDAGANNYTHPTTHAATMIVEDDNHQFITKAQKEQLTGNITYTNATPIVSAHGGVAVGETFDNVPISKVLDKILYPYVAPVVYASAAPANGGTFEIGVGTTVTSVTANVTKKARTITKVEVFGSGSATALATKTEGVANGGSFSLPFSKELKAATDNGTKFTVKVTDSDKKVTSANTGTFSLVYPFYQGVIAAGATADAAAVKALTKKVEVKGNKKWAYTATNQKMVFAYPASYGSLTKIFDANNFDVTGTFTKSTVNIACADGTSVPYNVYVNSASTVSGFNMDFRF